MGMAEAKKSKISNTEWGLLISALFVIDLIQIALDLLFQIGVVVNRFIDIFVGMALPFYLHIRGESMADPKRLIGLLVTFVGEEIPDVDALPLWGLDGIYNFTLSKANKTIAKVVGKVPGGQMAARLALKTGDKTTPPATASGNPTARIAGVPLQPNNKDGSDKKIPNQQKRGGVGTTVGEFEESQRLLQDKDEVIKRLKKYS